MKTIAVLLSLGSAAWAQVNTTCPVKGKAVNPSITTTYQGKTVAFC